MTPGHPYGRARRLAVLLSIGPPSCNKNALWLHIKGCLEYNTESRLYGQQPLSCHWQGRPRADLRQQPITSASGSRMSPMDMAGCNKSTLWLHIKGCLAYGSCLKVTIHVLAVTYSDHADDEGGCLGRIDDAVITDPYAIVVFLAPDLFEPEHFRKWIDAQNLQRFIDPGSYRYRQGLVFPIRRFLENDLIMRFRHVVSTQRFLPVRVLR